MGGKAIIILVMGVSMILGYIALNISRVVNRSSSNMATYYSMTESHNLATVGANVGLAKAYQNKNWTGTIEQEYDGSTFTSGSSFRATLEDIGGNRRRLRSVSTYPVSLFKSLHDTVEVFFDGHSTNSFTMFAWMTDFNGNDTFFNDGDTLWGRMQSNGNIHLDGKPRFWGKVTTSKGINPKPKASDSAAIFRGGYETGVAPIPFPSDLSELISAGNSAMGGRTYPGDIWITLSPGTLTDGDGKVYIRSTQAGPIIDSIAMSDPAFDGVIVGNGRVNVQGTLDGKLTITASTGSIYVQNDIQYENRNSTPGMVTTSNDLLGLVAEVDVVVADNPANNSNCLIDACIFCRTNTFTVENLNSLPMTGTLQTLGSIVQKEKGAVDKTSGSTVSRGYYKNYHFDDRLTDPNFKPPHFPGYGVVTYSITNWWESFRIMEFD